MEKEYKRVSNIKAECFDGSREMMKKYKVREKNPESYFITTSEGDMFLKIGYYIATGSKDEHWAIEPGIFKCNYLPTNKPSQIVVIKPTISKKVAELIKEEREKHPEFKNSEVSYLVIQDLKSELEYKNIRGDFDIDTSKNKKLEIINEFDTIFEAVEHGYYIKDKGTLKN